MKIARRYAAKVAATTLFQTRIGANPEDAYIAAIDDARAQEEKEAKRAAAKAKMSDAERGRIVGAWMDETVRDVEAIVFAPDGQAAAAHYVGLCLVLLAADHPQLDLQVPTALKKEGDESGAFPAPTTQLVNDLRDCIEDTISTTGRAWVETDAHRPVPRRGRQRAELPDGLRIRAGHSEDSLSDVTEGLRWDERRCDAIRAVLRRGLALCGLDPLDLKDWTAAARVTDARRRKRAADLLAGELDDEPSGGET